ncbi:hypothetical protein EW146_g9992 [Bondarzewia mesenterica]|uniref:Peptidase S1 domain-containing protein n=1 Tax=Bondarzewia mesenterica TaxID=1095465 RepID=A0A4S4L1H2_9AGAM|nr:hypothetical protein EW146_g9992 [Bondarzewia mesenterica]
MRERRKQLCISYLSTSQSVPHEGEKEMTAVMRRDDEHIVSLYFYPNLDLCPSAFLYAIISNSDASDLTIGHLNTIHSITRVYLKGQPGQMSKKVIVLPRNSKSGAFSRPGDSGSAVIDGKGKLAGLLTGGTGDTKVSDYTYLTSINFLLKCMLEYGLKANIYPSL